MHNKQTNEFVSNPFWLHSVVSNLNIPTQRSKPSSIIKYSAIDKIDVHGSHMPLKLHQGQFDLGREN